MKGNQLIANLNTVAYHPFNLNPMILLFVVGIVEKMAEANAMPATNQNITDLN
jgi:hypothetical protein